MRRAVSLLLLVIVGVAGCGDDDGSSSEAMSRAAYIDAADRLCREFMESSDALAEPEIPEEIGGFLDQAIDLAEDTSAGLAQLRPPVEAEEVHRALRASLDESLVKVREARQAVDEGDIARFEAAMDEAIEIGQRSDQAAKDFGFEVCGSEAELSTQ